MTRRRRDSEHGFALVVVLVMAAFVAIALYAELPRVLFEAQRAKEQLLIDRGNEYKRAIKVYVRKMQGRYPPTIDALVETNSIHFLRKKFKDPMTGKDEWRLIHIGPGGIFPDSLTQAPPKPNASSSSGTGTDEPTPQPMWVQRLRPSDSGTGMVGVMAQTRSSEQDQSQADQQALQPGQAQPGQQPTDPQIAGVLGAGQPQQGSEQAAGQTPGQPGYPTQNVPGLPGPYGTQVQGGVVGGGVQGGVVAGGPGAGMPPSGPGTMGGSGTPPPGAGGPPSRPGGFGPSNAPGGGGSTSSQPIYSGFSTNDPQSAQQMINTMIRQGGGGGSGSGNTFGALIAGVASQSEFEGIKTLDRRSKYKEWEFIYDMRKELMPGMGNPTRGFQGGQQGGGMGAGK